MFSKLNTCILRLTTVLQILPGNDVSETIKIGDKPLSSVRSTNSLGTQIDERLVWEEHIDNLCK